MKTTYFSVSLFVILVFTQLVQSSQAQIVTQEIEYQSGDVPLRGYLVYNAANQGKRPAILVVHEWWGHNAYARKRAEMLAELGYVGFALDMYGDGKVAEHPDDAKKYMQQAVSNQEALMQRFQAALDIVQQQTQVDPQSIAAIGYCFGGAVVLNMARAGMDLDGVVSFHGSLASKQAAQLGQVKAKVVVFHGANDAFIPMEQVQSFEKEMQAANVDYELIIYDGVEHSFTNPAADEFAEKYSMSVGYDEEADQDSWRTDARFFARIVCF